MRRRSIRDRAFPSHTMGHTIFPPMTETQPIKHKPPKVKIFFEGRYRKLVRDLPQTVFFCPVCKGRGRNCERCQGYGKLTKDSVQELIARVVLPQFRSHRDKFHGAGREDIDVRMLGTGRPFVFEIIAPKNLDVDLAAIEGGINERYKGRIEVENLRFCSKKRVAEIKEAKSAKEYRALVNAAPAPLAEKVASLRGQRLEIVQRTPDRVAHRRADLERKRWIEILKAEIAAEGKLELVIRSAHGTYIKEAVSGLRTEPSVSSLLGVPCECLELDVMAILDPEPTPAN